MRPQVPADRPPRGLPSCHASTRPPPTPRTARAHASRSCDDPSVERQRRTAAGRLVEGFLRIAQSLTGVWAAKSGRVVHQRARRRCDARPSARTRLPDVALTHRRPRISAPGRLADVPAHRVRRQPSQLKPTPPQLGARSQALVRRDPLERSSSYFRTRTASDTGGKGGARRRPNSPRHRHNGEDDVEFRNDPAAGADEFSVVSQSLLRACP